MHKIMWAIAAPGLAVSLGSWGGRMPQPATAQNPVSDALRAEWNSVKNYYVKSAQQMPDDNYAFKPTPDVRSFGEIIAHVAGANYLICAGARGEKPPYAEDYFEKNAKTKADIVKAATDSVAYCDGAFSNATDGNLADMINAPFGKKQQARAALLILNVDHVNEHYGNIVTYFRLKGMVPPSSQKAGS
ncbi:MAG TPA: DinB family protein [Vicinamibacterales bacterium]